jgi:hypothetical protein
MAMSQPLSLLHPRFISVAAIQYCRAMLRGNLIAPPQRYFHRMTA